MSLYDNQSPELLAEYAKDIRYKNIWSNSQFYEIIDALADKVKDVTCDWNCWPDCTNRCVS